MPDNARPLQLHSITPTLVTAFRSSLMHTSEEKLTATILWRTCFQIQDKAVPLLLSTLGADARPWIRENCLILLWFYVNETHLPLLLKLLEQDEEALDRPGVWIYVALFTSAGSRDCEAAMLKLFYGEAAGRYSKTVATGVLTQLLSK